jgi:hypothetical protein
MTVENHLLGQPNEGPLVVGAPRPDAAVSQAVASVPEAPAYDIDDEIDDQPDDAPRNAASPAGAALVDRKAAAEAYRKVMEGKPLTSREQSLVRRFEKEKEERLRWQYYASIPQRHWREMSGRQAKIINEQALRYDIPFGGATISLPAVVRSLHDFLADNAQKLARDDDDLMQGNGSPALDRYREERALIARLDRLEREGQLLPRDEVRVALGRIAAIVRGAGDTLQRQYGQAAADILLEALDDAGREIERSFLAPEERGDQPSESSPPCPAD